MFFFPMAGLSSRFSEAGYDKPKYYLQTRGGLNLFQESLKGFSRYFETDDFCFVYLDSLVDSDTIHNWSAAVGLPKTSCHTVSVSKPTRGQADTTRHGILGSTCNLEDPIVIFNVDTLYHDFRKADDMNVAANYLDVTKLPGDHWSFVDPDPVRPNMARRVVEKQRISNLCSVGLYSFGSARLFLDLYANLYESENTEAEEYVAPMYQGLIDAGEPVRFRLLPRDQFEFLGTPQEYEDYIGDCTPNRDDNDGQNEK